MLMFFQLRNSAMSSLLITFGCGSHSSVVQKVLVLEFSSPSSVCDGSLVVEVDHRRPPANIDDDASPFNMVCVR